MSGIFDASKFVVIIPARSGSSRMVDKNIAPFEMDGTSLVQRTILQAINAGFKRIITTSDYDLREHVWGDLTSTPAQMRLKNQKANILHRRRPDDLCLFDTPMQAVLRDVVSVHRLDKEKDLTLVLMQPTSPFRSYDSFMALCRRCDADSDLVRTSCTPTVKHLVGGSFGFPRDVPAARQFTGGWYVLSVNAVNSLGNLGDYKMFEEKHHLACLDINTEEEFRVAQVIAASRLGSDNLLL